jgi:hypothetical protein
MTSAEALAVAALDDQRRRVEQSDLALALEVRVLERLLRWLPLPAEATVDGVERVPHLGQEHG